MNTPSPTKTPPYRQGTPPPASFHSPTHHSPVHNPPNYHQTAVPPVPGISSIRRLPNPPNHFNSAPGKSAASPFTQINTEYQETMQQIGRSGGTMPSLPPRPYTPPSVVPAGLERRNSGSSKRSSISPRHSLNNSTSAT